MDPKYFLKNTVIICILVNDTTFFLLIASEDELSLMLKRPSRRRNTRHHLRRRGDSITPPESPRPEKDRRRLSSPIAVHAPIVITRGSEGFGFTLKAIRVYIGETSNYTVHHLVDVS